MATAHWAIPGTQQWLNGGWDINRSFAGDLSECDRLLGDAILLYQASGYLPGVANTRRAKAQIWVRSGKSIAEGLDLMRQVIADSQASGKSGGGCLGAAYPGRRHGLERVVFMKRSHCSWAALVVAEDLGDQYEIAFIILFLGALALFTGRYESAQRWIASSLNWGGKMASNVRLHSVSGCRGADRAGGRLTSGGESCYIRKPRAVPPGGSQGRAGMGALALEAYCLLQTGETAGAVQQLREVLELSTSSKGYLSSLFLLSVCALWLAQAGELEQSLELLHLVLAQQPLFDR